MEIFMLFALVLLLVLCVFATAVGLPGNYAMMAILLVFGVATQFEILTGTELAWLVGALVLGEVIEFFAGMIGVRREKAGLKVQFIALAGGIIGGIIGSGFIPLIGSVAGVVVGVFLATYGAIYYERKNTEAAKRVAMSAAVAQAIGTGMKVIISLLVITMVIVLLLYKNI